jgi:hypothetical protein
MRGSTPVQYTSETEAEGALPQRSSQPYVFLAAVAAEFRALVRDQKSKPLMSLGPALKESVSKNRIRLLICVRVGSCDFVDRSFWPRKEDNPRTRTN